MLLNRDALTGQSGFVHRGTALGDLAVNRDALPRFHDHHVPHSDLFHRDFDFSAAPFHQRGLGREIHQLGDCFACLAFGAGLQIFPQCNQRKDHCGRLEVKVHRVPADHLTVTMPQPVTDHIDCNNPIDHRRSRTNRNQGIHIGGAFEQRLKANLIVFPVHIQDRQREKELGKRK